MSEFLQDIRDLAYAVCVAFCFVIGSVAVTASGIAAVVGVVWLFS